MRASMDVPVCVCACVCVCVCVCVSSSGITTAISDRISARLSAATTTSKVGSDAKCATLLQGRCDVLQCFSFFCSPTISRRRQAPPQQQHLLPPVGSPLSVGISSVASIERHRRRLASIVTNRQAASAAAASSVRACGPPDWTSIDSQPDGNEQFAPRNISDGSVSRFFAATVPSRSMFRPKEGRKFAVRCSAGGHVTGDSTGFGFENARVQREESFVESFVCALHLVQSN
jgi:hypothetical protein